MRELFLKLGIIAKGNIQFKVTLEELKDLLYKNMDNSVQVSRMNATGNDYRGVIINNTFKLEENYRTFDSNYNPARIKGTINTTQEGVSVDFEVTGVVSATVLFMIVGFGFILTGIITAPIFRTFEALTLIPAGIFALIFMVYMARDFVSKMLTKFEHDIFYYVNREVRAR
ncbi:MAG: hypothetical protein RIG77_08920 [Cyclobacteriaceae bacterium]